MSEYDEEQEKIQVKNKYVLTSGADVKFYNINQGEYEGHWYFGKKVQSEEDLFDSVIFDDGRVFINYDVDPKEKEKQPNQIMDLGLVYKSPLLLSNNSWSSEGIKNYLSVVSEGSVGLTPHPPQKRAKNERFIKEMRDDGLPILYTYYTNYTKNSVIYTKTTLKLHLLKDLILAQEYLMDVHDTRIFLLTSCYIISTYLYSMFPAIGYLFFHSEPGSGKTKWADIIKFCSFNAINATSPSESVLFRIIEQSMGTLFIDDYENLPDERKQVLDQILKVGYRRGGQTCRSERIKDDYVPKFFSVYSPKVITNTIGLDTITLSRCIPIHLLKTSTVKGKREVNEDDEIWRSFRDGCYSFTMLFWRDVKKAYQEVDFPEVNNREVELCKTLLAVAKVFGDQWYKRLKELLVDLFRDRDLVEFSDSWEFILFDSLKNFLDGAKGEQWLSATEVCNLMKEQMDWSSDEAHPTPNWVGKKLSTVPLFRKRRVSHGVEYLVSKDLVLDYMRSRNFLGGECEG